MASPDFGKFWSKILEPVPSNNLLLLNSPQISRSSNVSVKYFRLFLKIETKVSKKKSNTREWCQRPMGSSISWEEGSRRSIIKILGSQMCTEQGREAVSSTVSADIKVAEELDKSAAAAPAPQSYYNLMLLHRKKLNACPFDWGAWLWGAWLWYQNPIQ